MTITQTEFRIINWRVDRNVASPHINPEVDFFEVNVQEYVDAQAIAGKMKDKSLPLAVIIIRWVYTIENKATKKEIFYYEAEDKHSADTSNMDNNEQEIKKTINQSYKRFTNYYDGRKKEMGVRQDCPDIPNEQINSLYKDVISRIQ